MIGTYSLYPADAFKTVKAGRLQFSISRSADNRNTSDNMERITEEVVTAAQIQALPALGGYVALAGDYAIARVSLPIQRFGAETVAFQESGNQEKMQYRFH